MKRLFLFLLSLIILVSSSHQSTTTTSSNPQTNSTCTSGLTGVDCSEDINECLFTSCNDHGTCINTHGSFYCNCDLEFTGPECQTDKNECRQSESAVPFCGNGSCINIYGSYGCECSSGYTGESCETEINECEVFSCANGECTDLVNGYQCDCYLGWTGQQCEVDIDECDVPDKTNGPCFDTGTISCTEGNNTYTCLCIVGYTGPNCSVDIPECETICMNYVECHDFLFGLYVCICQEGYTGENCEIDLTPCIPDPCLNGGVCYNETTFPVKFPNATEDRERITSGEGEFFCDCPSGYNGTRCEIDLPFCQPDSCMHNGTCVEGVGNATSCECIEGFSGNLCEIDLDYCTETVCRNGGTCVEGIGIVVTCFCPNGTVGPYCDLPEKPIDNIVLIIIIILVILGLFFLVCLITTLCVSGYWDRTRGKGSKRYEVNMWTLEYQQRTPVTIEALQDNTAPASEFDFRDVELGYMDTLNSHSSFESQTAMLQFTTNRDTSVNSSFRSNLVRTPSARSFRRTLSGRRGTRRSGRGGGDRVQATDEPLGAVEKGRLIDMLESGTSTFKPTR